jgi:hypothetical protein
MICNLLGVPSQAATDRSRVRPKVLCVRCSSEHMPLFRDDNELSSTAPKGKRDGSHAPVSSELFQFDYNPG